MFEHPGRSGTAALPPQTATGHRRRRRPAGPPAPPRRPARRPAAAGTAREAAPAYHTGPSEDRAPEPPQDRPPDPPEDRPPEPSGGQALAGDRQEQALTAGARGRAAVADLAGASGTSALAAAVGRLADAVDALARVDVADERDDDLGAAGLALHHLRCRLDAGLLDVLGAFDRREGYRADGAVTCGSWLRGRANIDHGTASTLLQTARRLSDLPLLAAHLAAGDVTVDHAAAVTRAAVPHRADAVAAAEPALAGLAVTNPPQDVRRAVRHLADAADADGSDPPDDQPPGDPSRELTLRPGFEGRGQLDATLDPVTREALAVLLDAYDTPDPADTPPDRRRSPRQRRHDAFAALLHTLLAQPDLPTVQGARPHILLTIDLAALLGLPADHPAADTTLADLAAQLGIDPADLPSIPTAHTGAGAPTDPHPGHTHAHADADATDQARRQPQPAPDGPGPAKPPTPPAAPRPARYGSGVEVDPANVRGLLHRVTLTAVLTLGPWRVVNVGARHRTLPAWLRAVLTAIHRHCRGPDCDRPAAWTQAHHITPWNQTHTTDLNDTLPLCPAHHDLITTKRWNATLDHTTGVATWTSPQGHTIHAHPPAP